MKKLMSKPVLAVLAAATIAGGLTPVLVNASDLGLTSGTKVVMDEEGQKVTRYQLKDLVENDPAKLNLLLKTEADHLYVVIDELNINKKMSDINDNLAEWYKIYKEHYEDIYLEVRVDASTEGFVSVTPETKDGNTYIKGNVSDDVNKVVITTPSGDQIETVPTADDNFTVSFKAQPGATAQYATLKAYVDDKLVDTKEVRVNDGTVEDEDLIIRTMGLYSQSKNEVKVNGVVKLDVDKVVVTYAGEKKEVPLKKLFDGVATFTVIFKGSSTVEKEATVEAYKNGQKVNTEKVALVGATDKTKPDSHTYTISGTATINAKQKLVLVKGTIKGVEDKKDLKLYIVAPDGQKQQVKLLDKGAFESYVSYKNRSFSSKFVRVELYSGAKLVAQTNIAHGVPANQIIVKPVPAPQQPVPVPVVQNWKNKGEWEYKNKDWKHKEKGNGHHGEDKWDDDHDGEQHGQHGHKGHDDEHEDD